MQRHRHYPNPDAVPYARTLPPTFPCQQVMPSYGKVYPMHGHGAWLNKDGDGNTDLESGHFHRVRGFKVLPDPSDGHTHDMTDLPCTAGAAHPTGRTGPLALPDGQYMMMADGSVEIMGPPPTVPKWLVVLGAVALAGAVIGGIMYFTRERD